MSAYVIHLDESLDREAHAEWYGPFETTESARDFALTCPEESLDGGYASTYVIDAESATPLHEASWIVDEEDGDE